MYSYHPRPFRVSDYGDNLFGAAPKDVTADFSAYAQALGSVSGNIWWGQAVQV